MVSSAILNASHTITLPHWKPHPAFLKNLLSLEQVQHAVNVIPLLEQQPPVDGEVYPTQLDAFDRLQNYSLCAGFQVVTASGGLAKGRVRYACIHGGTYRDTRLVGSSDSDGAPERQRKTTSRKMGCPWSVTARLADFEDYDDELEAFQQAMLNPTAGGNHLPTTPAQEPLPPEKAWILRIGSSKHNDRMAADPLTYPIHALRHPSSIEARAEARMFREAGVSYNLSLRLRHSKGLQLGRKAFYNTKRSKEKLLNTEESRINQMLKSLTSAGFNWQYPRWYTATRTDFVLY
ncbi:hypothetical protein K440DRAFT_642165 [Wilcoxina mikolae CBS 423.85]|nr:hypothetical protein K440DRAFT_642165 [Wilcoxina mikolae CBS 423.85]